MLFDAFLLWQWYLLIYLRTTKKKKKRKKKERVGSEILFANANQSHYLRITFLVGIICLFWTSWCIQVYNTFQLAYFHLISELSMRVWSCVSFIGGIFSSMNITPFYSLACFWIHCQRPGYFLHSMRIFV